MKTPKGLKEFNKMTTKELLDKSFNELWKKSLWDLGQNAFSTISKNGFESEYLERQQQNPYPYPSYLYPTPYNQNINYLPIHGKNVLKSKNAQYEMLTQSLSLTK